MSVAEIKFSRQGFQQDIRSDGRSCTDFRPLVLDTGDLKQASGSAHLRLGGTDVVVGVKARHAGSVDSGPMTLSFRGSALLLMLHLLAAGRACQPLPGQTRLWPRDLQRGVLPLQRTAV